MTKGEQARLIAWRLKVLHQAPDEQNVARSCVVANGLTELRNRVLPVNMNGLRFAVTEIVLSCLHSQSSV